eukprot:CAMPEP_0177597040 /NCGR_PEP_ID=MMETSP0419_2-20121207/11478_1 /TAXON_ID=582737 /ORGANISM="Tetraselmis sp., Strain GSL018" /LENGTH=229 /DNA_ID=CAMNT_0019089141 /DNA_START=1070 /DNA_END=1755 /DNA_ORIENTATION=+
MTALLNEAQGFPASASLGPPLDTNCGAPEVSHGIARQLQQTPSDCILQRNPSQLPFTPGDVPQNFIRSQLPYTSISSFGQRVELQPQQAYSAAFALVSQPAPFAPEPLNGIDQQLRPAPAQPSLFANYGLPVTDTHPTVNYGQLPYSVLPDPHRDLRFQNDTVLALEGMERLRLNPMADEFVPPLPMHEANGNALLRRQQQQQLQALALQQQQQLLQAAAQLPADPGPA